MLVVDRPELPCAGAQNLTVATLVLAGAWDVGYAYCLLYCLCNTSLQDLVNCPCWFGPNPRQLPHLNPSSGQPLLNLLPQHTTTLAMQNPTQILHELATDNQAASLFTSCEAFAASCLVPCAPWLINLQSCDCAVYLVDRVLSWSDATPWAVMSHVHWQWPSAKIPLEAGLLGVGCTTFKLDDSR